MTQMVIIRTEEGLLFPAEIISRLEVDETTVLAWIEGDNRRPYEVRTLENEKRAMKFKACLEYVIKLVKEIAEEENEFYQDE